VLLGFGVVGRPEFSCRHRLALHHLQFRLQAGSLRVLGHSLGLVLILVLLAHLCAPHCRRPPLLLARRRPPACRPPLSWVGPLPSLAARWQEFDLDRRHRLRGPARLAPLLALQWAQVNLRRLLILAHLQLLAVEHHLPVGYATELT